MDNEYGNERLQVRCQFDTNRIHVQGVGTPTVNRKYGIALELRAPPDLTAWLNDQTPTESSPASGSLLYIPMYMYNYVEQDNVVQLLIEGEELNHPKGAMLDVSMESPAVETLVDFVRESQSGLTLEAGKAYQSKGEEE